MSYRLLITTLVALPLICFAQKNKRTLDSLERLVSVQKDSALVGTYNELTWEYRLVDRDKAIDYGNKAIALGNKLNYVKGVAQAYNDLGIIFYDKENYDTAIYLYNMAVGMRQKMNDERGIAKLYNKIGIVYQRQGKFAEALDFQLKALPLFEKFKDDIGVSYSLNNIGILQQNLGRYDEAIIYQQRSIAIKEKIGDKIGLAGSYVNIANIYLLKEDFARGEDYYKKAVDVSRSLDNKEYLANALNNLGGLHLRAKKYDAAIPYINESYQVRAELKDTKGMVSCMTNLGEIYIEKKMYDTASALLNDALQRGLNAVNCAPEVNKIYQSLSKLYERTGDMPKALEMYKKYATTKDSLFNDDLSKKFAELEVKYETVKKEQIIEQNEHKQAQDAKDKKILQSIIIGIAGVVLLASLLIYSQNRKNKAKKEAQFQQTLRQQQEAATKAVIEAEEEERKRIARDLHDGVGQMMSAAKMNLSSFESNIQFNNTEQRLAFEKIIGLVDESCKEVRSVSHNMMPNALLKSSLASAVQDFIDKLDKKTLQVHLFTEGLNDRLDSNVETVLYRVIQECVNNVIKHSGANTLDITVIKDKDGISATIEDNGKGFDVSNTKNFTGIGMKNILTRVEYLKGTVEFDSIPGKGTAVVIHVPL
jgi:two-component system, NarL family, sensor kinase